MGTYEELLGALKALVLERGEVKREELLEWGRERSVGTLTLLALVGDLEKEGVISVKWGGDPLELPVKIEASTEGGRAPGVARKDSNDRAARAKIRARKSRTGRRSIKKRRGATIVAFFEEETRTVERPRAGRAEERAVEGSEEERVEEEEFERILGEIPDEDYKKALTYLAKYRSVGEVRLSLDLMKEGVRDVERVLRRLLEEGYATRSPLGVINATEKLPRINTKISLADLLG